jgi:hypothetical protein
MGMIEKIEGVIYLIRGHKVMLDSDLAVLYGIPTFYLNQQVRRNIKRFPEDFMFQLKAEELERLRLQFAISNKGRGGRRYLPYVFTEQGVAMLSSVLNSPQSIQVNIQIMRTFVRLRQIMASNAELAKKIDDLENKYDGQFKLVFDAIRQLVAPPEPKRRRIGFIAENKFKGGLYGAR